jgi:small multidrug resistance pump
LLIVKLSGSVFGSPQRGRALFELLLAIASEQVGTSAMKASQGFALPLPTLLAVIGYLSSLFWFARSMKVLPMGFAYALWVGLGMIVASMIGLFCFGEALSGATVTGLLLIAGGIFVLNSVQGEAS